MTTRHEPTIGEAVLLELILATSYVLLIIMGARQPGTLLGQGVEGWIDLTAPAVRIAFALVPIPSDLNEAPAFEGVGVYRHILTACVLIACACFLRSRQDWSNWAERIMGSLSAATIVAERRRYIALYGYRRMIIGISAVMLLALFGEYQIPALANYFFTASWTYIRAPLLIAIAYMFACHAAALRHCMVELL